ncbi:putative beta-D-galactosidase [Candidatus Vecturithrix granuli]|uniref:Putative beta-D-galactosidase n=1 Tax=Vecturithrix granuli TaxID=1499967 RepID=A0A081C7P8_VECG1|nr:putative beta-D-galactosidase [Candidatus Vecturithrix granuli]
MIYDTFEHIDTYCRKDSPLYRALKFAAEFDLAQPDGRCPIDGEAMYALVSTYDTSPREERRFEAHKKYLDVQVLLEGEECIDVSLEANLPILQEYNETKDIYFVQPPAEYASLPMKPGYFAVFYPQDIHRPNCQLHRKSSVRKIVVKVRVE